MIGGLCGPVFTGDGLEKKETVPGITDMRLRL
jgi:hypothetical protein